MKLPHYVLLAGLLVIFLSCSAQSNDIGKSDIYFSKALNLFEDSKFSKAKSYFQNIIDQFAGTEIAVDAKYYLAYCEYELNDFQNSKQSFMIYKRYSQDILKIQSARYMICMCMFNLTLDHSKDQSDTYYALEEFQTKKELSVPAVNQPIRISLTGSTKSPGLGLTLCLFGKDKSIERISNLLNFLS